MQISAADFIALLVPVSTAAAGGIYAAYQYMTTKSCQNHNCGAPLYSVGDEGKLPHYYFCTRCKTIHVARLCKDNVKRIRIVRCNNCLQPV